MSTRRPPLPEYTYSDLKRPIEIKGVADDGPEPDADRPCNPSRLRDRGGRRQRDLFLVWEALVKTPMNQAVINRLLLHLNGPQPYIARLHDGAARSLVMRGYIRLDRSGRATEITYEGRRAATKVLARIADHHVAKEMA